jgi:hypothetical protein
VNGFVESAINEIIAPCMIKKQMRWNRWAVRPFLFVSLPLDETLETLFRRRYPDFRQTNDPVAISVAACMLPYLPSVGPGGLIAGEGAGHSITKYAPGSPVRLRDRSGDSFAAAYRLKLKARRMPSSRKGPEATENPSRPASWLIAII